MYKKIIAGVLVLIGLALLFSNQINEMLIGQKAQSVVKETNEISAEKIKENTSKTLPGSLEKDAFDFSKVEAISVDNSMKKIMDSFGTPNMSAEEAAQIVLDAEKAEDAKAAESGKEDETKSGEANKSPDANKKENAAKNLRKYSKDYIVGILKAPSVDLELAILRGVLNENLYIGAGTMKPSQVMGKGNYALAGHHLSRGALFHDVPDLRLGAKMYITDKNKIYAYKVTMNKEIHETEVGVIDDAVATNRGKAILTLITCYTLDKPHIRTVVQGELVETIPYSPEAFQGLK